MTSMAEETRLECLRLAHAQRAIGFTPEQIVQCAKVFEDYVTKGTAPTSPHAEVMKAA